MSEQFDELQTLRDLRDLLEPPGNWTTGTYARNADGRGVGEISPIATCWCLRGGVARLLGGLYTHRYLVHGLAEVEVRLKRLANREIDVEMSVADFNDTHTHREVLELIDAAIAEVIAERTAQ